jgi:hypothetical protein
MEWLGWAGALPAPVEWSAGNEAMFWAALAVAAVPAAVAAWRTRAAMAARARLAGLNVTEVPVAVGRRPA